jgi:hypothetical protein
MVHGVITSTSTAKEMSLPDSRITDSWRYNQYIMSERNATTQFQKN